MVLKNLHIIRIITAYESISLYLRFSIQVKHPAGKMVLNHGNKYPGTITGFLK
jgi:hypothetical protein